ncbi:unnamed protein product [Eruca vesicaria subsp. sativa]|uniref:Uncharacterized protein n=1 Tax=Eruca vesicaria subsp. sativa TaxID=29727 RepID=A0ABC8IZB7_ERUVS|nr:unnamed protein product [Eruca vesicaria subsp. sativa]
MANSRVLFSDVKSARCYSNVEARLLRMWEARSGRRGGQLTCLNMLMIDVNRLGNTTGKAPKDKLGNIDRCKNLYEHYPSTELESSLAEIERARAELAISQPELDMPELLWKEYIDFEIAEEELERTRVLSDRLLDRPKYYTVWVSFGEFVAFAVEQEEDEDEEHQDEIDAIELKKECIRRARGNFVI